MFENITLNDIYNREELFESLESGSGIVLIGRAGQGPSMIPIRADNATQVMGVFGSESELANGYMEAKSNGAGIIYLIRMNGTHSETNVQDFFTLTSLEAIDESIHFQYQISTSGTQRYLSFRNTYTDYLETYDITGKKISQIVSAINIDASLSQCPVCAAMIKDGSSSSLVDELYSYAQTDGGSAEYGNNDTSKVFKILESLEPYSIAQIGILSNAFFDKYDDIYLYQKLADFTYEKVKSCTPCIITIGLYPGFKSSNIICDMADTFNSDLLSKCQVSEYVNVIIAQHELSYLSSDYISNGVAAYCGIIDSTHYSEGTTNRKIYGATTDLIALTPEQREKLTTYGYVTTLSGTYSGEAQFRIYKGTNLSKGTPLVIDLDDSSVVVRKVTSPLSNIANIKLIQHILLELEKVIDTEDMSTISTLKSTMTSILDSESNYIKEYTISESNTYKGYAKTQVFSIELTPIGEIESISITVQAK